jgi:hypothetical protein
VLTADSAEATGLKWAPGGGGGGSTAVQDEGVALTARSTINFIGAGVTAADDAANSRTNVTIPGGGGSGSHPGSPLPGDLGFKYWDYDLFLASASFTTVAGVVQLVRFQAPTSESITNVHLRVSTAGATVANAFAAVVASDGTVLGTSADISTTLQSTGFKTIPVTASVTGGAGVFAWVAVLVGSAGTLPQLSAVPSTLHNDFPGAAVTNARHAKSGTGQTAMPGSFTPSSFTLEAQRAFFVGAS